MSLAQKILDAINAAKNAKDTVGNSPGPLTGMTKTQAHVYADQTKSAAQDALDDPTYTSITPVLLSYRDDVRADTRAAVIHDWANEAKTHNDAGEDQDAADCLHSVVQTVPQLKFSIDYGPGGPS